MHRRIAVLAVLALLLTLVLPGSVPAAAAPFSAKAFADAQNAGKSIVVFVHAPW
jgi:hypothetical protein